MKTLFLLLLSFLLVYSTYSKNNTSEYFKFIDPVPNAKYVNPEATIIIKPESSVDRNSLVNERAFLITGSLSGACNYNVLKSSDDQTIILKPVNNFRAGETVKVEFTSSIKTTGGGSIKPFSFSFSISQYKVKVNTQYDLSSEVKGVGRMHLPDAYYNTDLIQSFPQIILKYYSNPAPGRIFMSDFSTNPSLGVAPYMIILNNNGLPFYSQLKPAPIFDFNMQPDGNLSYFNPIGGKYYEINSNYQVVDSFYCGNGYGTDLHELRVLSNRHALLMAYDSQQVDMSHIVPGGSPQAVVSGLIIQEIDESKNVVFQWRSWDHFQITDAWHENMYITSIDAVHGNAIELDNDGNLLISSRHLDEITKINRSTGEVVWRLGGKHNQFTFTTDTLKFTYQHAIRRLNNGNIILYDNGNWHVPKFSRACEYKLDEVNKTAALVWQYRNSPDVFGGAMGFVTRLDNGNSLISWGFVDHLLTEVKPNGTKTLEMLMPGGVFSYRAQKHPYKEDGTGNLIPESIFLNQNFPNPFNPTTSIKFGVPRINGSSGLQNVKLAVYDILGQQVAVLVDDALVPDSYQVDFYGGNLSSGVYFYTLQVSGGDAKYNESKKMILVK